jgi:hypothetical protein
MVRQTLQFRHQVIDADPPGSQHDITLIADLTGSGRNDIIIGGKEGEVNLFWYENPSWTRHDMASALDLEAGGALLDITGNGKPDIIAGQQLGGTNLFWFECPADPRLPWTVHVIEDRFKQYHDQAAGDVDGDGRPEVVMLSQKSGILGYYDIPDDPRVSPWPRQCFHLIADEMFDVEGLAIVDIDGDGRLELIAGPSIFRPPAAGDKGWQVECFAPDFVKTRVAVADLDGDGKPEVVLCEGESHPGRLAWLSTSDWKVHILRDDLFHPHSLEIADFNGNGHPDILAAEMGLGQNRDPKMLIFLNQGKANFTEVLVAQGIPTHEAKVGDLTGDGRPDIVGKPYYPERHIDVWFNQS